MRSHLILLLGVLVICEGGSTLKNVEEYVQSVESSIEKLSEVVKTSIRENREKLDYALADSIYYVKDTLEETKDQIYSSIDATKTGIEYLSQYAAQAGAYDPKCFDKAEIELGNIPFVVLPGLVRCAEEKSDEIERRSTNILKEMKGKMGVVEELRAKLDHCGTSGSCLSFVASEVKKNLKVLPEEIDRLGRKGIEETNQLKKELKICSEGFVEDTKISSGVIMAKVSSCVSESIGSFLGI